MKNSVMIEEERINEDEINLLDYWKVLVKRKVLIGIIIVVAFISSIIYSLFVPAIYSSSTTILPPQQENSGIVSQLPSGLGGIASGYLGISSPADLWIAILGSEAIKDGIINRLDLLRVFETNTMESARHTLAGMVKTSKVAGGIISITVEDKDPQLAAILANSYVEELDRINKEIIMTSGRRMRVFVEKRLKEAKDELEKAEDHIKKFQETNRAVKLDDQSKIIIEAIGSLNGQLMAKEVELQTLLSYATPNNPQAELLKTQVEELKERLRELEEGKKRTGNPSPKDVFIPTSRIPDVSLQYARLLRDTKVQETLYQLLTQQYEMASIQEAKDTPTVQVLDIAKVPENRIKPKRRQIVLFYTVTGFFLGILIAFSIEYIERLKRGKSTGVYKNYEGYE